MIELMERWSTEQGKILYNNVLKAIKNSNSLSTVKSLGKHEGRWDLRGLSFPIPRVLDKFEYKGNKFETTRSFNVKYARLENVDFSYSIFYRTV